MRRRAIELCFVLLTLTGVSRAASPEEITRFAVVIGNNRPEPGQAASLRYADDDAVATHQLFSEAGARSFLLVHLDDDSQRLSPTVAAYGKPRWSELSRLLEMLAAQIRAERERGHTTELLFSYSGHGDVAHGEGYVLLEDRRLTRTMLHEQILRRLGATRNHVLVDACKSYFLVFDKGPGGSRRPYRRSFAQQASSAETGFILSTSSARDSHEWERYQAGIFSHEVRSALRGAADADGNGQITYAELGAFLRRANESIANHRFRPDFVARPPGGQLSSSLLAWRRDPTPVVLDRPRLGHVFVEGPNGERILDAHAAATALVLHVPAARPLFIRKSDGTDEFVLTRRTRVLLSALRPVPQQVARKGALHLAFERLFALPFGEEQVAQFVDWYTREGDRSFGEEPALQQTVQAASTAKAWQTTLAVTAAGTAAAGLSLTLVAVERHAAGEDASQQRRAELNSTIHKLNMSSIVLYSVAGAAGISWLLLKLWPTHAKRSPQLALVPARSSGATLSFGGLW